MGQKVNPHGLRVGIIKDWDSKWYADKKNFGDNLVEDYKIRKYLKKALFAAGVAKIEIERTDSKIRINIYSAKPGIIIGKGGAEKDKIKANVENLINELTILDELKLDGTINLKDLILLPDITEKNIPLIAKLCASPYFNKSKQGVETIELTDETLQKAAKRHSKVLKYKKDKETGTVTITVPKSFIVGYT
jgi:hypothetical protein